MYIVAIAKIADSRPIIALNKLFDLHYCLTVEFLVQIISTGIRKSNVNIIIDTKLQPYDSLHSSN